MIKLETKEGSDLSLWIQQAKTHGEISPDQGSASVAMALMADYFFVLLTFFCAALKRTRRKCWTCRKNFWSKPSGTYFKKRILVQNQGGREYQPGGILQYFEDLI